MGKTVLAPLALAARKPALAGYGLFQHVEKAVEETGRLAGKEIARVAAEAAARAGIAAE